MENADHIIDLGPQAGLNGGNITAEGNLKNIIETKESITGNYLSGKNLFRFQEKEELQKMEDFWKL